MGDIVTTFASGFTGIITPLSTGIKTGFTNLIYVDPAAADPVLSAPAQVGLIVGGMAFAVSLVVGIFHAIRKLRG